AEKNFTLFEADFLKLNTLLPQIVDFIWIRWIPSMDRHFSDLLNLTYETARIQMICGSPDLSSQSECSNAEKEKRKKATKTA
ncbi:hypothetical protein CEXT_530051, partial [Caerostris extrusa]